MNNKKEDLEALIMSMTVLPHLVASIQLMRKMKPGSHKEEIHESEDTSKKEFDQMVDAVAERLRSSMAPVIKEEVNKLKEDSMDKSEGMVNAIADKLKTSSTPIVKKEVHIHESKSYSRDELDEMVNTVLSRLRESNGSITVRPTSELSPS